MGEFLKTGGVGTSKISRDCPADMISGPPKLTKDADPFVEGVLWRICAACLSKPSILEPKHGTGLMPCDFASRQAGSSLLPAFPSGLRSKHFLNAIKLKLFLHLFNGQMLLTF